MAFDELNNLTTDEDELVKKGFIKTSLGSDVLRTETVPLMIASVLKYLRECE